jgi:hypothetical protein
VGLSDDQKAMLRLLAQREEGYEDMAALMGISVEEVRERVKEALAEVDVDEPQAAEPPSPPPTPAPEPAPAQPAPAPSPAASKPRPKAPPRLPKPKLPKASGPLAGIVAGLLALVVLVVVLVVGGGDDESDSGSTTASQGDSTLTAAEERNLTQALLAPTGDQDASGRALFGRLKQSVLLQVEAEGLDPSPQGESYTVWLYRSPKLALQVGSVQVGEDGRIAAQFQIPAQLLTYVANGAFNQVDVSLTSIAEYKAAFNKAKSENKVPPYIGESVLRGEITGPAVQARQSAE